MYWPGCVESRIPSARASAPTAASSAAQSAGWERNCGRSGCDAYGASAGDHAVHADVVRVAVAQDRLEALERHPQVRLGLPSARVVGGQVLAQHLDRESQTHDRRGYP